ncbi:MAG: hypothetical protein ACRCS3_03315 [Paracoccaceae bacterium]
MTDNTLVLLAFGVFSTALVLVYLLAIWVAPRISWLAGVGLIVASVVSFVISSQQAAAGAGENPGIRAFLLGAILGIAAVGGVVGAVYGTWKARHR